MALVGNCIPSKNDVFFEFPAAYARVLSVTSENVANAVSFIKVEIHADGSLSVEDDGRGMPVDIHPKEKVSGVELILTRLHAGGKFDSGSYGFSGGLHGVGVSVTNALAKRLEVTSYRESQVAHLVFAGGDVVEKMRLYHERTLLIAQIETERGLENVEEIAAVDGVDVLWVGHFDLSNFMGIPAQFDHPKFTEAMTHVAQVARKHGKVAGFMATDQVWIERAKGMGYTMLAAGTDTGLMQQAFGQLIDGIN